MSLSIPCCTYKAFFVVEGSFLALQGIEVVNKNTHPAVHYCVAPLDQQTRIAAAAFKLTLHLQTSRRNCGLFITKNTQ